MESPCRVPASRGSAGRDLKRASTPDIDRPLGETAVVRSSVGSEGLPRGQRVLDGLSGDRVEGRLEMVSRVTDTDSSEIRMSDAAMIP